MYTALMISTQSSTVSTRSSTVRKRILEEHRVLRDKLDVLELLVDGLREDPKRSAAVSRTARDVLRRLIAHVQLEDAILAPLLRSIDAWGPVRESDLLAHHAEQREQLQALIRSYGGHGHDIEELALRTLSWISDARADMDHEERSVLSRELLDDSMVAIDGEAG
jgi:hypothetical protein